MIEINIYIFKNHSSIYVNRRTTAGAQPKSIPATGLFAALAKPSSQQTQGSTSSSTIAYQPSIDKNQKLVEYNKKMKKLNQSFLAWMERQIDENPLSIWKEGVKVCVS